MAKRTRSRSICQLTCLNLSNTTKMPEFHHISPPGTMGTERRMNSEALGPRHFYTDKSQTYSPVSRVPMHQSKDHNPQYHDICVDEKRAGLSSLRRGMRAQHDAWLIGHDNRTVPRISPNQIETFPMGPSESCTRDMVEDAKRRVRSAEKYPAGPAGAPSAKFAVNRRNLWEANKSKTLVQRAVNKPVDQDPVQDEY